MSSEILISREEAKASGLKTYFTGVPCLHGHVSARRVDNRGCVECTKRSTRQWHVCNPEYKQQHYQDNIDAYRQQRKKYYEENRESIAARSKQHYENNTEQYIRRSAMWNKENPERFKQQRKKYREENPERFKQQRKKYREENPEQCTLHQKKWREDNPEYGKQWREDNTEEIKRYAKAWRASNRALCSSYDAKYKATKLQATPTWAELDLIQTVYEKRDELNSKWGTEYEVDHIIPLQSDTVCGLHVWANLQLLESKDNGSKNNRYQQDW